MTKSLLKLTITITTMFAVALIVMCSLYFSIFADLRASYASDESEILTSAMVRNPQIEVETCYLVPQCLGKYKITHYCACEQCCGIYASGYTSTGAKATAGRTIAVDPTIIPYGSKVLIGDTIYTAEDCGGAIKGNVIDVYVDHHSDTYKLGVYYTYVYLVK